MQIACVQTSPKENEIGDVCTQGTCRNQPRIKGSRSRGKYAFGFEGFCLVIVVYVFIL